VIERVRGAAGDIGVVVMAIRMLARVAAGRSGRS
jgi:hypothetical protein